MAYYPFQLDLRLKALYDFGLSDLWCGRVTLLQATTALMLIPDGDPLWKTLGGARALSDVELMRIQTSFLLEGLQYMQSEKKGNKKPEPEKPPPLHHVESKKRAEHRKKMRARSARRKRVSHDELLALYQKQAEVGRNGQQHTHLQGIRGGHSDR